jgi:thioredoxin-related protein
MVSFEQGSCHACDLLHTSPLNQPDTLAQLEMMNSVQLDMWSDTPVVTPDGYTTTARDWANQLGLFFAPTLIFFDAEGKEIIRIDSVVKFYRLLGVLNYINQGGYLTEKNYQTWQLKQRKTN